MNPRRIVKALIPTRLFKLIEPYGHLAEAIALNLLYGFPGRRLKVIGVTGTNGKTTTSFLIYKMLHETGYKVGLMTTVAYGAGDEIHPQVQHVTNVPVFQLMSRLKWMKSKNVEWLVLETTSHALAQHRVWGIPFDIAVITNVTHEHLDYHGNFSNYLNAKRRLFKLVNRNKSGHRTGVVNADDANANLFIQDVANPVTYGLKAGEIKAKNVKSSPAGSSYEAEFNGQILNIKTKLPGSFNVSNSLAAVAVGCVLGLKPEQIEQGIATLENVAGRMTTINAGQKFSVIVDFAHTPDSFEKLFKDLRPTVKGKLIVMFGSAGRRDKAKRAVQGELAGKFADLVVLTEEDDRDEDGMEILNQIASGAEKPGKVRDKNLFLVLDRTEAIKLTLDLAKQGDTVLLLGKGHEKTIERVDGEHPWNEVELAKKTLSQTE